MEMGIEEIKREYKYAKNQKKSISILADLNCCSKEKIMEILGLEKSLVKIHAPVKKRNLTQKDIERLFARLDELNSKIKPLEDEYEKTVRILMSKTNVRR